MVQPTDAATVLAEADGFADGSPSAMSGDNGPAEALGGPKPGHGYAEDAGFDLHELLHALQAMRVGDFSVRLPGGHTGIAGKIADTFDEIVAANQRMAQQLEHVGHVVGREARRGSASRSVWRAGLGEMEASVNTLIDDLLWPTTAVTRAIAP
jgi:hypothetical protein